MSSTRLQDQRIIDLKRVPDARITAVIDSELARLQCDVAAFQEARLADSCTLRESCYPFFCYGYSENNICKHGVGFSIKIMIFGSTKSVHMDRIEPCI